MATKFFLFLLCMSFSTVEFLLASKVKHFKWEIGHIFWSPDCEENIMIGINGKFPGPTVEAMVGDTIVVELKNSLHTEGVVIHWHGIRQFGTPWADGTAFVSQCPINPGETFTYRFTADKAGTYFYHGHYGMQRAAGLYGSLIVNLPEGEKEPFHYDKEINLLLSDWYHQNVYVQAAGLFSIPFRWIGEPQTILINGRGQYNCSLAASGGVSRCINNTQCAPVVLNVLPNKTYRVRIASVASLVPLNLAIGSHKMTLVEADGNYIEPFTVNDMDIYSGESYSVLITTDQNSSSNYWISIGVRGRPPETPPALAILNYHPNSELKMPSSSPPVTPVWSDYLRSKNFIYRIFAKQGTPQPPTGYQSQIKLINNITRINGHLKWLINNVSLVLPPTPYIGSLKRGLKSDFNATKPPVDFPEDYDLTKSSLNPNPTQGGNLYWLKFNTTVDVILQNANGSNDFSEIHPWHLHGHDFWVLGYGDGNFTKEDIKKFNLKNPPLTNTVVLFPLGWTAIRFVADNPGVWAFHCHTESHLHMGMGVIFPEGVHKIKDIPKDALACGMTGKKVNEWSQTKG